jgi:protoporphyrinogen oxidase
MQKNIVISGSGISGLLSALLLCKTSKNNIYVIEKNNQIGGLLKAFNYGENGDFDYGMHNFLETGVPELDKIMFEVLPESEWQILDGSKRDLAGIYFNGKLQKHTPYIDLRNLSNEDYRLCLADFFDNLNKNIEKNTAQDVEKNALDYSIDRFGKVVTEKAIAPALEKVYKTPAHTLDYMATLFTPMSRITLFDEPLIKNLIKSDILRDRIAFVDQRNLPLDKSSGRRGYYPKKYGMYRFVEALKRILIENKVIFLTGSEITSIDYNNQKINSVEIKTPERNNKIGDIDKLIWTANLPLLGKFLKLEFNDLKYDKPLKTVIVNILLNKKPEMDDLYYFFCYAPQFNTFRLTNFINYCDGASRNNAYPICMELLVEDEQVKNLKLLEELAIKELHDFGILAENTKITFTKAEVLESGFPMPSKNNINSLKVIREGIKSLNLENLYNLGILAEKNLFFQTDVLIDSYNKIKSGV